MSDPQDQAEMLDEDIIDSQDDRTGDEYGAGLPEFPPEEPLGVEAVGTTPVEEDAGESFAERTAHERPEADAARGTVPPTEERTDVGAEDLAMHVEPELDTER